MDPAEKLLADIQYWENEEKDAEKRLRYARAVLPNLRDSLELLSEDGADRESCPAPQVEHEHEHGKVATISSLAELFNAETRAETRLFGSAGEQVEQALTRKSPQSSVDLAGYLRTFGKAYSRGAIDYALRDLHKEGKIKEAGRAGNLRYWEPASLNPADPA